MPDLVTATFSGARGVPQSVVDGLAVAGLYVDEAAKKWRVTSCHRVHQNIVAEAFDLDEQETRDICWCRRSGSPHHPLHHALTPNVIVIDVQEPAHADVDHSDPERDAERGPQRADLDPGYHFGRQHDEHRVGNEGENAAVQCLTYPRCLLCQRTIRGVPLWSIRSEAPAGPWRGDGSRVTRTRCLSRCAPASRPPGRDRPPDTHAGGSRASERPSWTRPP